VKGSASASPVDVGTPLAGERNLAPRDVDGGNVCAALGGTRGHAAGSSRDIEHARPLTYGIEQRIAHTTRDRPDDAIVGASVASCQDAASNALNAFASHRPSSRLRF
jgi:hypothetical protein